MTSKAGSQRSVKTFNARTEVVCSLGAKFDK